MTDEREGFEDLDAAVVVIEDYLADGDFDQAEEALDEAIGLFGEDRALLLLRAEVALDGEEYEECLFAVESALNGVDDDYDRGQLLEMKGYAHFYLGQPQEARKAFNQSVRLGGASWMALIGRAMVHEELFFHRAAMLDLERAIEVDDQEPEPFAIRGGIRLRAGQLEDAEADLKHAVELDPHDGESRLNLARLQATDRRTSAAIETLEPLVEDGLDPENVMPAALLRSQLSLTLGSTDAAADDAQRAIDVAPDQPWGYLQLAAAKLTARKAGDAIEAIKQAEKRVDDVRDIPDAFALRASAYDQLEKPEKAQEMRDNAEGVARLPGVVYGEALNPASNIPINPNKPMDVRTLLTQLFGDPSQAPEGYEDALRSVIDRIPEMIESNPDANRIKIQLPEVEGMEGGPQSLVLQVNRGAKKAQPSAEGQ